MSNWNRLQYFGTSLLDTLQESDYTTLFPNYILNEKIEMKDDRILNLCRLQFVQKGRP